MTDGPITTNGTHAQHVSCMNTRNPHNDDRTVGLEVTDGEMEGQRD